MRCERPGGAGAQGFAALKKRPSGGVGAQEEPEEETSRPAQRLGVGRRAIIESMKEKQTNK